MQLQAALVMTDGVRIGYSGVYLYEVATVYNSIRVGVGSETENFEF